MINEPTMSITVLGVVENRYLLDLFLRRDKHVDKVAAYTKILLQQLCRQEAYKKYVPDIDKITLASKLHDIGKAAIDENILYTSKKTLQPWEKREMRYHAVLGANIIREQFPFSEDRAFKKYAENIARYHHEHWNGTGYPSRVKGKMIPLEARVTALADAYDKLRCGDTPFSHEDAAEAIIQKSGKAFAPDVVKAFQAVNSQFTAIHNEYENMV